MKHDLARGASPFLQCYTVTLESGAVILARVLARSEDATTAAATMAKEAAQGGLWDSVAPYPRDDAQAARGQGFTVLLHPRAERPGAGLFILKGASLFDDAGRVWFDLLDIAGRAIERRALTPEEAAQWVDDTCAIVIHAAAYGRIRGARHGV